jgi:sucrose-6-phosphate hydrolase SacC (GH32 family)
LGPQLRWTKLGKIFDPAEHGLPFRSVGFAQSPQALVLDDRVRVYFSTREQDRSGKYLSHVAFVDFDKAMQLILDVSRQQVISLGGLGCFDEHGIFPISVLKDDDRVLAYTTGWNRKVSVSADAAIGFAISKDRGLTFEKYGSGPIMAAALNEPFLVGDAFVRKYGTNYHMWYIFGIRWTRRSELESLERVYKIAHAISPDGVNWRRDGRQIIPDKLNADECQALPSVIYLDGTYHMFFCYREAHGFRDQSSKGYRIGYASSTDLVNWARDDLQAGIDVSTDGWDSQMQCYPNVFQCEGKVYMLYNGNQFGRHGFGLAVRDN